MTQGRFGDLITLPRYPEQIREIVKKFDLHSATASWTKMRDLRHTLIQHITKQICFGTGEDKLIERIEDVRCYVGGISLFPDLCLSMRIDLLLLIKAASEIVTVYYDPILTFAFPDTKEETYRRLVLHLNLISVTEHTQLLCTKCPA